MVQLTPYDVAGLGLVAVGLVLLLRRGMPKAYALGLLMLASFALDTIATVAGARPTSEALSFVASEFVRGDRPWSPITSIFSHAGFGHIFGNLFILVTAGPALEERVGARKFLVIFFLAALVALAAHTLLAYTTTIVSPASYALGASGGIFGVLSAFAVRYPREKLPVFIVFFLIWMPAFAVLLLFLGFNLLYMFTQTSIAWWGHFAGFLVGLAFAYSLPPAPVGVVPGAPATGRGLPDAEKLAALATTPDLQRILERLRQFTPETRTKDDAQFADAWLTQFFAKATCPAGHAFRRDGLRATCAGGETTVEFGR